ncbi:MAG TPA: DUF1772 domain-containing protein [Steroidobacteraceae bacterium]|jgi:uncharacterized membrane protein|nr:DUF1772 domain-containing protein [Steroidobacteraceae bacterium]
MKSIMLRSALLLATAILLALIAGRAFWVWLGESPFGMTGATYVDFFQHLDSRIAFPIAMIGILGPLLAGLTAALMRADRPVFYCLVAACLLGVIGVLVTVAINAPINEQIADWKPAALPAGYEDVLQTWWTWHIVRTIADIAAMCAAFLALLAA